MGACAQIPVLFVMRGVIIKFSQISPGSFRHAGRNYQILCVTPPYLGLRAQRSLRLSSVPTLRQKKGTEKLILSPVPTLRQKKGTEKLAPVSCAHAEAEEGHREACACPLCPR